MKLFNAFLLALFIFFSSCIGDDIVMDAIEERLSFSTTITSLKLGESFQLEAKYFDNIGMEQTANISWESSNPAIISVDDKGLITALALGSASISATTEVVAGNILQADMLIDVTEDETTTTNNIRIGELQTTSSYVLEGGFSLEVENGQLILKLSDDYRASSSLPGLYVYLTNNPSTNNNALEISEVSVFSGAHTYEVPGNPALDTYNYVLYYCKPFGVKVGDGEIQ